MPQYKGKSKSKNKKGGKEDRALVLKDNTGSQKYAVVHKALGGKPAKFIVKAFPDGKEYIAAIRGSFRRGGKDLVLLQNLVLLSLNGFGEKATIIHNYSGDEAKQVKKIERLSADCAGINEDESAAFDFKCEGEESDDSDTTGGNVVKKCDKRGFRSTGLDKKLENFIEI